MLRTHMKAGRILLALTTLMILAGLAGAETIRVGVGHQSMCTDTYASGIVVKEMGFLEKRLPHTGKYKDVKYEIDWKDYTSGPPITNMMLANKLDFGVMGDYPLIVNGAKFQETKSIESIYISGTSYNLYGSGNAIVVPANSDIYSLADLKGKDISMPVGSAAWGMIYKAMQDAGIPIDAVTIKNQSPAVGAANIAASKIDAHADFCPWSELMEFRGTGRKIYDGSEAGVPYLHGTVVRKDYAEKYPEIVVAFLMASQDAAEFLSNAPQEAAEKLEKWTGVEKEVQYLYFSKGGHLTSDLTIKPKWVEALKYDHQVLAREKQIPALDFDKWITDKYVRRAYKELGLNYEKQVATVHDPKVANAALPMEVWHAKDGIKAYPSVGEMLKAVLAFNESGQKVYASYVYDDVTRLKLFGHVAYYVRGSDGAFKTFMRKPDAEAYAKKSAGKTMAFSDALEAVRS